MVIFYWNNYAAYRLYLCCPRSNPVCIIVFCSLWDAVKWLSGAIIISLIIYHTSTGLSTCAAPLCCSSRRRLAWEQLQCHNKHFIYELSVWDGRGRGMLKDKGYRGQTIDFQVKSITTAPNTFGGVCKFATVGSRLMGRLVETNGGGAASPYWAEGPPPSQRWTFTRDDRLFGVPTTCTL